jgi:hypothetical protein
VSHILLPVFHIICCFFADGDEERGIRSGLQNSPSAYRLFLENGCVHNELTADQCKNFGQAYYTDVCNGAANTAYAAHHPGLSTPPVPLITTSNYGFPSYGVGAFDAQGNPTRDVHYCKPCTLYYDYDKCFKDPDDVDQSKPVFFDGLVGSGLLPAMNQYLLLSTNLVISRQKELDTFLAGGPALTPRSMNAPANGSRAPDG